MTEEVAEAITRSALATVPGLRDVAMHGRTLVAQADHGATAVPSVLGALDRAGVNVASATMSRPSLDDVYLRFTGRRFAAGDRKEAA